MTKREKWKICDALYCLEHGQEAWATEILATMVTESERDEYEKSCQ